MKRKKTADCFLPEKKDIFKKIREFLKRDFKELSESDQKIYEAGFFEGAAWGIEFSREEARQQLEGIGWKVGKNHEYQRPAE